MAIFFLSASLITLIVTDYLRSKQKNIERLLDNREKVNREIYSPLLFSFFEFSMSLSILTGIFRGCNVKELSKEQKDTVLQKINKEIENLKNSDLKQLLLNKIAFIKNEKFRQDIFFYYQLLRSYQLVLTDLSNTNFFKNIIGNEKILCENFEEASNHLSVISSSFQSSINELIHKGDLGIEYKETLTEEKVEKIIALITLDSPALWSKQSL